MNHFLLACMPKSGSTYLAQILANMPGMRREHLVPGYERREQELCTVRLMEMRQLTGGLLRMWREAGGTAGVKPVGFVAQHHLRFSKPTKVLIDRFELMPIVLVRNIFDVVPSLYDHVRTHLTLPMAFMDHEFLELDEGKALDMISDLIIPWYFNFYVSWSKANIYCVRMSYEDVIADPEAAVANIYRCYEVPWTQEEIAIALEQASQTDTRKNKGVVGRGDALPGSVRDRIKRYATYYPGVDFSPIGLSG
ncbi:MAG: sulfotransferase domain-containing protein [Pseudomonadota bacterium]